MDAKLRKNRMTLSLTNEEFAMLDDKAKKEGKTIERMINDWLIDFINKCEKDPTLLPRLLKECDDGREVRRHPSKVNHAGSRPAHRSKKSKKKFVDKRKGWEITRDYCS